jgi:YegS/Rv2252/BmrU family lipid kinase
MDKRWFVIINTKSGKGAAKSKWQAIEALLNTHGFQFEHHFTEYHKHSTQLIQMAVNQGYTNIICVGGDGTIHNVVNGIMLQDAIAPSAISLGIIPIGTGNDWVKTHSIPKNINKAIAIIKNGAIAQQDIGKIELYTKRNEPVYFNNLAGVGFDGYVVSKVEKLKHLGAVAYILGALSGVFNAKNIDCVISTNTEEVINKSLMVLVGICQYSGGGMRLTDDPKIDDGLFDISAGLNFTSFDIIRNIMRLFNGKLKHSRKVWMSKSSSVSIAVSNDRDAYIQADGELIGKGGMDISLIPKALSFYCPKKNASIS